MFAFFDKNNFVFIHTYMKLDDDWMAEVITIALQFVNCILNQNDKYMVKPQQSSRIPNK